MAQFWQAFPLYPALHEHEPVPPTPSAHDPTPLQMVEVWTPLNPGQLRVRCGCDCDGDGEGQGEKWRLGGGGEKEKEGEGEGERERERERERGEGDPPHPPTPSFVTPTHMLLHCDPKRPVLHEVQTPFRHGPHVLLREGRMGKRSSVTRESGDKNSAPPHLDKTHVQSSAQQ